MGKRDDDDLKGILSFYVLASHASSKEGARELSLLLGPFLLILAFLGYYAVGLVVFAVKEAFFMLMPTPEASPPGPSPAPAAPSPPLAWGSLFWAFVIVSIVAGVAVGLCLVLRRCQFSEELKAVLVFAAVLGAGALIGWMVLIHT